MVPWSFEFQTHINIALLLCRPQHFNMKTFQMFYTLQHKPTTMKDEGRRFKLVDHDFPIHQTELCPNRIKVISSGIRNTKQWSLITCPNNESTFPYFWCASHISATHRIASHLMPSSCSSHGVLLGSAFIDCRLGVIDFRSVANYFGQCCLSLICMAFSI